MADQSFSIIEIRCAVTCICTNVHKYVTPQPPCGKIELIGKGIPMDDIRTILHKRLHACNNVIPEEMKSSLKALGDELTLGL